MIISFAFLLFFSLSEFLFVEKAVEKEPTQLNIPSIYEIIEHYT